MLNLSDMCKGVRGGAPPGSDPVRYPQPPFDCQRLGPPSSNFWSVAPTPSKIQNFTSGRLKYLIVEILMKIVEIEVLFSISGYISLLFDLYNAMFS